MLYVRHEFTNKYEKCKEFYNFSEPRLETRTSLREERGGSKWFNKPQSSNLQTPLSLCDTSPKHLSEQIVAVRRTDSSGSPNG